MKQYSIFFIENGRSYPIFSRGLEYYLGGNRLDNLLFYNKTLAENLAKRIRFENPRWLKEGKIKVLRAEIIAVGN